MRRRTGKTLTEMMVVAAIILLLIAIVVPVAIGVQKAVMKLRGGRLGGGPATSVSR